MENQNNQQTDTGDQQDTSVNVATLTREDLEKLTAPEETGGGEPDEETKRAEAEAQAEEERKAKEAEAEAARTAAKTPQQIALEAENEKLRKRAEEQEKFLARQSTEIGLLRKKTPEQVQTRLKEIRDLYTTDPIKGHEEWEKFKGEQANEQQAAQAQQFKENVEKTKEVVTQLVPDFEASIGDIAAIIKADGLEDQYVENFKKNPYVLDHTTLFNLRKRVELSKEATTLRTENEALKKENAELKAKPQALLKKIEAATRSNPVTAKTGGAGTATPHTLGDKHPSQMSAAELAEVKKQLSAQ